VATSEITTPSAPFDPASIPAPPLQGYHIRADMTFAEAAAAFDEDLSCPAPGARYRGFRTIRDLRTKLKALNKFFGRLELRSIHLEHLRTYQKVRTSNEHGLWAHTAGANKVNAELGLVVRVLRLGKAWTGDMEERFHHLQVDECEIPKALSEQEQEWFLKVAAERPEWDVVYWYSLVALHICFSSDEMRTLRQGDVNLAHQIIAVNRKHGKNKWRRREVPLEDNRCLWALNQLLERSYRLVGQSPEKYLFPARVNRNHFNGDFSMGETGIRKQFDAVRDTAGLKSFTQNGWRHTAITRMAEAGVPIATMMARAGHCSPKMTAHYTHISMQAERIAMQRMTQGRKVTPRPPEPPQTPVDLMDNPAIKAKMQAEIERQVAILLQREREQYASAADPVQAPAKGARVITFPGKGDARA
jgi:integrase